MKAFYYLPLSLLLALLPDYAMASDGGAAVILIFLSVLWGPVLLSLLIEPIASRLFIRRSWWERFKVFFIANFLCAVLFIGVVIVAFSLRFYEREPVAMIFTIPGLLVLLVILLKLHIVIKFIPEVSRIKLSVLVIGSMVILPLALWGGVVGYQRYEREQYFRNYSQQEGTAILNKAFEGKNVQVVKPHNSHGATIIFYDPSKQPGR